MNALLPAWLDDVTLAWPWLLIALPLPLLARWLLPPVRSSGAALKVPFGSRLEAVAAGGGGRARAGGGSVLLWLAWAALCVAAARPQQFGDVVQPPQTGRDMMLVVDLSGSMGEEDMRLGSGVVDRLTAAKAVLADFLDRRVGDRVALLVFGQRAYALTPLTLDRESVRQQLLDSVVGLAGRETAIGDAIGLAVKRLRGQPADQRVVILLTDGVSNAGLLQPLKAAELAAADKVRVYTIAFGSDSSGVSIFGLTIPSAGAADMDEGTLKKIAALTGGRSFRARDTAELAGIYAEIERLEPVARAGRPARPRNEEYRWPLGAALLLGLVALAVPRRRSA